MENIVRLTMEDLEDFLKSISICFPDDCIKREDWIELLEDKKTFVFAIKENNIIKAYIAIYNWKGENDYIKIMSIGTHPDHRNKGYAHMLMQYIIDEMLKDDIHRKSYKQILRSTSLKLSGSFNVKNSY